MRYLTVILLGLMIGIPTSVSAQCGPSNCNDVLVERMYVSGTVTYVRTSGDEDQLNCTPGTGDYLRMRRSAEEYEDWYALVLTAFTLQAPISFHMESGTGNCYVEYIYQDR